MINQQQKLILSLYMEIYELVILQNNLLQQIKELVDFSFISEELIDKYCFISVCAYLQSVSMICHITFILMT